MILDIKGLQDIISWENAGVLLPKYNIADMRSATEASPSWVHFGAGNIFRGFIAALQQRLLNDNHVNNGIIAVETFDHDIINDVFEPHDNLVLQVGLHRDGAIDKEVIASIAQGICADITNTQEWSQLIAIFNDIQLQMVSFTITEKGYSLTDVQGGYIPQILSDINGGPDVSIHAISVLTSLLLSRFHAGAHPIALVSMDNCNRNGDKLRDSVVQIARGWHDNNYVNEDFLCYITDNNRVSYPLSMIDKITPSPSTVIFNALTALGIDGMTPIVTNKNTFIAPFVNVEIPQYLVIEDKFPNGRPPLEKAGVYFTDRKTVLLTEQMKVTTCLNPLHTAMSIYGSLLGYDKISNEMDDPEIVMLINRIGYTEGIPVVTNPGIISPMDFIDEVIKQRLPNPFIPDTPQRINNDISQKIPVRFGETIKAYTSHPELDVNSLIGIPLALAGWMRYLLALDDNGNEMFVSSDPMFVSLQDLLASVRFGDPDSFTDQLKPVLSNPVIFGIDLYSTGLGEKVENIFRELIAEAGAVRRTLKKHLSAN